MTPHYKFALCVLTLTGAPCITALADAPVHWEIHPTHALDVSPDRTTLALAHTEDARALWFDVTSGNPVLKGQIRTGLAPVSVRFRTNNELWVVNHLSDSLSIVQLDTRSVVRNVLTANEPRDVVFAGQPVHAYVSAAASNRVQQYGLGGQLIDEFPLQMEEPRALAVSTDRNTVIAASFFSGNQTTILAGGTEDGDFPPNVLRLPQTPYGGIVPPPNTPAGFSPPLNPELPPAPPTGLIVRKDRQDRWLDVAGANWTPWVSGGSASASGRVAGWDVVDHDIAMIDTRTGRIDYVAGLWNIGMAMAVNPQSGRILSVGTDATNEVRFEPNLTGTFIRVLGAMVQPTAGVTSIADLNPHLDYSTASVAESNRILSIGDPRSLVWAPDGSFGYVAGMGSDTVIRIDSDGRRDEAFPPVFVGAGPNGLALDDGRKRLYVWNRFEASVSTVDTAEHREISRLEVYDPQPETVRRGRQHFYNTHNGSGLGQAACASCHVDARTDRLAWDLGSPSDSITPFEQNCLNALVSGQCDDFHPLKGPMTTQTLQDIIGKEPFHWRGDRDGLSDFNANFVSLQGAERGLTESETTEFAAFLASIHLPPNPFRPLDNGLPTALDTGETSVGRFSATGTALPPGNAARGMSLFRTGLLVPIPGFPGVVDHCTSCHSLPTGMGVEGRVMAAQGGFIGGSLLPLGPNGEHHLGIISIGTISLSTFKVPQLRTLNAKSGMRLDRAASLSGFGFSHDGAVDTLARFLSLQAFDVASDQEIADLAAFMLAFPGSDLPTTSVNYTVTPPMSKDTHAAVGQQRKASHPQFAVLEQEAQSGRIDLVADCGDQSLAYDGGNQTFVDDAGKIVQHLDSACSTIALVAGHSERFAFDTDGDGVRDREEIRRGSHPADPTSVQFTPRVGLWYNPSRPGHGLDIQLSGSTLVATWYTYEDDGTPTWYQAVGPLNGVQWSADLVRYERQDANVVGTSMGVADLSFSDRATATWTWTLGERSGAESIERFAFDTEFRIGNYTGLWFDATDIGWGISVDSLGDTRVVVLYFYDDNNQPRWALGSASNAPSVSTPMDSFTGFCPDCVAVGPVPTDAGSIMLNMATTETGTATISVASPVGSWDRSGISIERLTSAALDLSPFIRTSDGNR